MHAVCKYKFMNLVNVGRRIYSESEYAKSLNCMVSKIVKFVFARSSKIMTRQTQNMSLFECPPNSKTKALKLKEMVTFHHCEFNYCEYHYCEKHVR